MAGTLPKLLVMKSIDNNEPFFVKYGWDGPVVLADERLYHSTLVVIELERSGIDERYFHLRFIYVNKYMEVREEDKWVVAVSNRPENDTGKASCTLFEPIIVDADKGLFYLIHVHSGARVMVDGPGKPLYVEKKGGADQGFLEYVDWGSVVKLPHRVAFVGENSKYLRTHSQEGHTYLQFSSDDAYITPSTFEFSPTPDARVRVNSRDSGLFWRRSPNWIWSDYDNYDDPTASEAIQNDTLFWPVKKDHESIALRNLGNGKYCKPLTAGGKVDCLNAEASTMTDETLIQVRERVFKRRIFNVTYQLDCARVRDELERSLGSVDVVNQEASEASVAVTVEYEDSRSYTFERIRPLLAGVPTTVEAGLPEVEEDGSISVKLQIKEPLIWGEATLVKTQGIAFGTVTVPPKSSARVSYVGTIRLCDVPFDYTQHDQPSASDETKILQSLNFDGFYHGTNTVAYKFVLENVTPL